MTLRGRKRAAPKMTERLTVPMKPDMLRAIAAESEAREMPAAEWIRKLIETHFIGAKAAEAEAIASMESKRDTE